MPEEMHKPWFGDVLPPPGTVCEIAASTEYLNIRYPEGARVKVYANFTDDRGVELAAFVDAAGQVAGVAIAKCFRPTTEQIAAEERETAISEMASAAHRPGQICVTKREMAERLYEAGYRKQVTP